MEITSFAVTAVAFAVAIGVLVVVHELGHFLVAKRVGVKVHRFSIGFGPVLFARRRGETEYAVSAVPMGGYVKMLGEAEDDPEAEAEPDRAFLNHPRRAAIVAAGPAMNFLFAFLAYTVLFGAVGVDLPSTEPRVGGVSEDMPAAAAGLRPGDRIVSVDDRPVETWEQLSGAVTASGGRPLQLLVERDGRRFTLRVTPSLTDNKTIYGETVGEVYRIGIEASHEWQQVGWLQAIGMGAEQTVGASATILLGLVKMVQGRVPMRELGGPIAIAQAAGRQAREGARYYLSMLAFLSVNLAVLNLLPIPALDGGHLAVFGLEAVLRRPLRRRHREIAQQVGILLLITLMVLVFYNDIHRLVQG